MEALMAVKSVVAGITIISAFMVVESKRLPISILWLAVALTGVSSLIYTDWGIPLAAGYFITGVGGLSILILLVATALAPREEPKPSIKRRISAGFMAILIVVLVFLTFSGKTVPAYRVLRFYPDLGTSMLVGLLLANGVAIGFYLLRGDSRK